MPNTGEANDEMCAPMAPKISEMFSLKLEAATGFAGNHVPDKVIVGVLDLGATNS